MTKVQSLIQDRNTLVPVEVELTLWPGLPGIQFLGLPDQHLKESSMRIKSAIKAAGFQFPVAQQILVNLRPSHLKKTSRGVELAVAAAYLMESEQVRSSLRDPHHFIYGELTLSGDVLQPEDLNHAYENTESIVLTGRPDSLKPLRFRRQVIQHLKDLARPQEVPAQFQLEQPERPSWSVETLYSKEQARLIEVLAVGEHSALLAGAAGSGKSTIVQALPNFLKAPTPEAFRDLKAIHREFGEDLRWRPVVKPHHSTPTIAMIGGGSVPFAGEISRAHGGVLILDELLEFKASVQEALREPFEEGKMRVFRNGKLKEYPARAQILGTTNLCPCGQWTPQRNQSLGCQKPKARCSSYRSRLSGPLVDRFEILHFTEGIGELCVPASEVMARVQRAQEFREGPSNAHRPWNEILSEVSPAVRRGFELEEQTSQRRKLAVVRVARTLADLDLSRSIGLHHVREARQMCLHSFQQMAHWG